MRLDLSRGPLFRKRFAFSIRKPSKSGPDKSKKHRMRERYCPQVPNGLDLLAEDFRWLTEQVWLLIHHTAHHIKRVILRMAHGAGLPARLLARYAACYSNIQLYISRLYIPTRQVLAT